MTTRDVRPRPEFEATLEEWFVAALTDDTTELDVGEPMITTELGGTGDIGDVERPRRERTSRTWLVAAAVVVVVAGLTAIVVLRDGDEQPADEPVTTVDTTVTAETIPPPREPGVGLPGVLGTAEPGRYSTDLLGVPIDFTIPRSLLVSTKGSGEVVLIGGLDPATFEYRPADGISLAFRRLAGWSTREEATSRTPAASIDPNDIDAWVDANDIVVLSDAVIEVAGRPVRVIDVTVDPESTVQAAETTFACFAGWDPCFHFGAVAPPARVRNDWVSARRTTRFYLVPIEGYEPLLIEVGSPPDSTWIAEIEETMLPSLWIGPDGPPPER